MIQLKYDTTILNLNDCDDHEHLKVAAGDTTVLQGKGSVGRSRSGDITPLVHGHIKYKFVLTFNTITSADRSTIRTFLQNSAGLLVEYTDINGTVWDTIILNPNAVFVQHGRNRFSLSLELEGVPHT
jgi:hypothetical protein